MISAPSPFLGFSEMHPSQPVLYWKRDLHKQKLLIRCKRILFCSIYQYKDFSSFGNCSRRTLNKLQNTGKNKKQYWNGLDYKEEDKSQNRIWAKGNLMITTTCKLKTRHPVVSRKRETSLQILILISPGVDLGGWLRSH